MRLRELTEPARDIVVTTPRAESETAAAEARQCLEAGGGAYFRTFRRRPKGLAVGSRIFYVEDGYLRGYAVVAEIVDGSQTCGTTGRDWGEGVHAVMPAESWTWIRPLPMKGFQGHRYLDNPDIVVVGGWQDPKPPV